MKYYTLRNLTPGSESLRVLTSVEGHYIKDRITFFVKLDSTNDNEVSTEGIFSDFLKVDETIKLGRNTRNYTAYDVMYKKQPGGMSFMISPRLRAILDQFNLASSKFFGGKRRSKGLLYYYNVVQFLDEAYKEFTDITKSTFVEQDYNNLGKPKDGYTERIMDSFEALAKEDIEMRRARMQLGRTEGWDKANLLPCWLWVRKLVLKPAYKDLDMFMFRYSYWSDNAWIISERLRDALIENKIKDIEIKELENIEIVIGE